MNAPAACTALRQYRRIHNVVDGADPHRLIQMLLEGALERVAAAKGHALRVERPQTGAQIGKAIDILGALRAALNPEVEAGLVGQLDRLYDYMQRRLLYANLHTDPAVLDEVSGLLRQIKSAWDAAGTAAAGALADG